MTQVYQFVDDNGVTRLFAEIVPDPAGTPFNGGTITEALNVAPPGTENNVAVTADATASGNSQALSAQGRSILDRAGVTGSPLVVMLDNVASLTVDSDGKTRLTPTTNGTAGQPALDVDAIAAITTLLRLRSNSVTMLTLDNAGTLSVGSWLFSGDTGTQIVASGAGSDIELCDSGSNIVVQVTDTGRLGFYNHAATAQQTGVAVTAAAIHAALVNLGLITA